MKLPLLKEERFRKEGKKSVQETGVWAFYGVRINRYRIKHRISIRVFNSIGRVEHKKSSLTSLLCMTSFGVV